MSDHTNDRRGGSELSPTEELVVLKVGVIAIATVAGSVFTVATWHHVLTWAVAHQVHVPAHASPLVTMPAGNGVGLDGHRLAIAIAATVMLIVCAVTGPRRHFAAYADGEGAR